MNNGISPLMGEDGRALQASIAHLPPDQQQQHVIAAAQSGLVPFSVAVALQAALKHNAPLAQAPAPGNVVNDMVRQLAGGQPAPQMPMPQMPMPQQGAPAQPMPGLAGLPVSNIGTQAMAGGGIVSFNGENGSLVNEKRFSDWLTSMENDVYQTPASRALGSPEVRALLARVQRKANPYAIDGEDSISYSASEGISGEGGSADAKGGADGDVISKTEVVPTPSDGAAAFGNDDSGLKRLFSQDTSSSTSPELDAAISAFKLEKAPDEAAIKAKAAKEFDETGLGQAERKRMETLLARGEKDKARFENENKWKVAKGFFDAAAKGNPTLVGALSDMGSAYAGAKSEMSDKIEAAGRELEDQKYAVEAAQENLKAKRTDKAQAEYDKALARYDTQRNQYLALLSHREDTQSRMDAAIYKANAKAIAGKDKFGQIAIPALNQANQAYEEALSTKDPEKIIAARATFDEVKTRVAEMSASFQGLDQRQAFAIRTEKGKALAEERKRAGNKISRVEQVIAQLSNKGALNAEETDKLRKALETRDLEIQRIYSEVADRYNIASGAGLGIDTGPTDSGSALSDLLANPPQGWDR